MYAFSQMIGNTNNLWEHVKQRAKTGEQKTSFVTISAGGDRP